MISRLLASITRESEGLIVKKPDSEAEYMARVEKVGWRKRMRRFAGEHRWPASRQSLASIQGRESATSNEDALVTPSETFRKQVQELPVGDLRERSVISCGVSGVDMIRHG